MVGVVTLFVGTTSLSSLGDLLALCLLEVGVSGAFLFLL